MDIEARENDDEDSTDLLSTFRDSVDEKFEMIKKVSSTINPAITEFLETFTQFSTECQCLLSIYGDNLQEMLSESQMAGFNLLLHRR